MYLEYFAIKEFPFRLTPDADFLYMSSVHARAKAYMDYSVWNREGFVVITGEVGCGKTTLIQKLLSELSDEDVLLAKIFQTQLDDVEFLQAILVEFGLNPFSAKKVELMDMLNTFLIERFQQGKQAILIVDEAHNLSMSALEELRMLSGLETQKEKILHIILVGQPQLNEILDSPEMEQLTQRVRLRFHLKPLSLSDTSEYIQHRLRVAGAERSDIFTADTTKKIFEYTGGTPRLINTLCDTAMTCAYADSIERINVDVINSAIEELQWQPFAKRMAAARPREQVAHLDRIGGRRTQSGNVNKQHATADGVDPAILLNQLGTIEALLRQILLTLQGKGTKTESSVKTHGKRNQG